MRTTLTLDDDVEALLKRVLSRRKASLKAVVNEALRQGLRRMHTPPQRGTRYRTPSVDTGRPLLPNVMVYFDPSSGTNVVSSPA